MTSDNSSQLSKSSTSNGENALKHILDEAMKLKSTDQIRSCLNYEGIESIEDLMQLSPEDIADLKWNDGGSIKTINKGGKGKLIMLQRFSNFWFKNGKDIITEWHQIDKVSYDSFILSTLSNDKPESPNQPMYVAGILVDKDYVTTPITSSNIR